MNPVTRIEYYLAKLGGEDVPIPVPVTRIELYLAIICGEVYELPKPVTRLEQYLYIIAGGSLDIPKPVTKIEMYLAAIAGMELGVPVPVTRIEYYLALWYENGGGEIVTATGVSPLALLNALAKPIRSLTQYGLCSQSATPTPSAPVDIMCNNGALRMVDDELPAGYKRITGIKFDGDFWYNTNEPLTGDDDVTMTLANTVTSGQNVFGSYNGTASGTKNFSLFIYGGGSQSNSYFRYGEQLLRPRFGSNEHTITFGKSGTDGFATDVSGTPETFTTPANAYIGMLPNSTSPAFSGSIIGNILVGNRLKYIPCERQSDNAVGYYELNSDVFLEPVGTGTPTKGNYDTSHLTVLSVVGTPEVLTIGADGVTPQTVTGISDLLSVKYSYLSSGTAVDEQDIVSGKVTRRCGVKVLDGTEEWTRVTPTGGKMQMYIPVPEDARKSNGTYTLMCSHFQSGYNQTTVISTEGYCHCLIMSFQSINRMSFTPVDQTMTKDAWTAWVAEQYAAGTPVIVVYPLATPTTEQTTPHALHTSEGDNVVDVTANVSPIDLSVEYEKQKS